MLTNCDTNENHSWSKNSAKFPNRLLSSYFRSLLLRMNTNPNLKEKAIKTEPIKLHPVELNSDTFMNRFNIDSIINNKQWYVGAFTISSVERTLRYFLLDSDFSSNKLVVKESKIKAEAVLWFYIVMTTLLYNGNGKIGHYIL